MCIRDRPRRLCQVDRRNNILYFIQVFTYALLYIYILHTTLIVLHLQSKEKSKILSFYIVQAVGTTVIIVVWISHVKLVYLHAVL